MNFDPNDYEDKGNGGGGNFLPIGKHVVRVVDHELSETRGGAVQLVVEFEAKDGRTRKAWLMAEGKAGFHLAKLFRACGWTSKIDLSASGMIKRALYGKDVEIVVEDETYEGKTQTKVKWINALPDGGGRREEPRREQRREEPTRGGGGYGGNRGGYGGGYRSSPPPDESNQPYTPDDDIPF